MVVQYKQSPIAPETWGQQYRHRRIMRGLAEKKEIAPELLRMLILTARQPHAVLGISPWANLDKIRVAEQSMRAHARRLGIDSFIVINTIERAAVLMLQSRFPA